MGQGSGDCIDFDGGNDVVEITDNQSFAASGLDFTVECWIKSSDGSSTNMAFVTNYGGGAQNPFSCLASTTAMPSFGYVTPRELQVKQPLLRAMW